MKLKLVMCGIGVIAGSAIAQTPAKEAIISDPAAAAWSFEGQPKVQQVKADGLPGGSALLVTVAEKPARPWNVQARMKLKDGVAVGDVVTFGVYARADKPDPGKDSAAVAVRIQRGGAPYDAAIEGPVEIGRDWRFYCLAAPAKVALGVSEIELSVQMGIDKHAVAFGPYMVTKIPAGSTLKSQLPCGKAPGAA